MKFKDIQKLSDVKFRRLTGVSWATFNLMLAELNKQGEFKHEVRQFEKSYDNQQAEQISLMV